MKPDPRKTMGKTFVAKVDREFSSRSDRAAKKFTSLQKANLSHNSETFNFNRFWSESFCFFHKKINIHPKDRQNLSQHSKVIIGVIQKIRVKIGGREGYINLTQNVTVGEGGVYQFNTWQFLQQIIHFHRIRHIKNFKKTFWQQQCCPSFCLDINYNNLDKCVSI